MVLSLCKLIKNVVILVLKGVIMEQDKVLIGQKVKEIRKKNKLTQEKFCEKIGIEPSSLSNIETGKSFPSLGTVLTIMEKFEIQADEFFNFGYFAPDEDLEQSMFSIIKNLSSSEKQLAYRILKQFNV